MQEFFYPLLSVNVAKKCRGYSEWSKVKSHFFVLFLNKPLQIYSCSKNYKMSRGGHRQLFFESAIAIPQLKGNTYAIAIPQLWL
jgi:hypothetical protein